ncbi:RDD family protein [Vulcaniibacterium tengchongense]|uniref:Putative RDD family membrane protein YckC n=1 Tax=Vulcaniibacterium tengchongense TaxID=1273429 RepID=A0A3N4VDG4_9GAMM|nr:RDD family protein [Vulcaniibacterium tengchongense]RPE79833.1 putative RDD family membrane protein YckC [Vulcaniibacterium tengchongense]
MNDWYYHVPGQGRVGPLPADAVRERYRRGEIDRDTLAWHPGVRDWQPLDRFSEQLELDVAPLPEAAAPAFADAGAPAGAPAFAPAAAAPGAGGMAASPYAPPQAALAEDAGYHGGGEVVYAGFWKRAAALMIDQVLVAIAYYVILIVAMVALGAGAGLAGLGEGGLGAGAFALLGLVYLLYPLLSALYFVGFESSPAQATLGKMAVGIKVVDASGRRLGRAHALGRWVSHLLGYFTLYVGYLMAAFTERKRGLHDMAAGVLVVDRWAYTGQPQRQRRALGAVTIAVLVLGALLLIAYLAVLFAVALPAYQSYLQRAGA